MIRRIFVPLDGTRFSEYALPFAVSLARRTHASIALVHVHVPGPHENLIGCAAGALSACPPDYLPADVDLPNDCTAGWLQSMAQALRAEADVPVLTRTVCGPVVDMLCEEVAALAANLVVMATHARSGFARARLGSVGDALVRYGAAPVLLVQPMHGSAASPEAMPAFRRILAAHDGSTFSRQILPHARALAYATGAGLAVAHAPTAAAIRERADAEGADVIALATHGRGGLSRLLLGSTADEIVRSTGRSVLLVRPGPVHAPVRRRLATHGTVMFENVQRL
jgi:nucleotide-binding universal stress UspA family protein